MTDTYRIKTPKGYVHSFNAGIEAVVFTEDPAKACRFQFKSTLLTFVEMYADCGYGLNKADMEIIEGDEQQAAPAQKNTLQDWQDWLNQREGDDGEYYLSLATYLRPAFKFERIDEQGRAVFAAVPYRDKDTKERQQVAVRFEPKYRSITVVPTGDTGPCWAASFTLDTPPHIINATALTAFSFPTTPKHPQKA